MKVLECSTKGDKRFSALCAKVKVFGKTDTIENWYQLSKSFSGRRVSNFKEAKRLQHKGEIPTSFFINNIEYDIKYISQWYTLLWVKYLDKNKELVEYAREFDEYTDCFKTKDTINCQADVIRDYIKNRNSLINICSKLSNLIIEKEKTNEEETKA